MNSASSLKCSFSKSETKQLRNKDVRQRNTHVWSVKLLNWHTCGERTVVRTQIVSWRSSHESAPSLQRACMHNSAHTAHMHAHTHSSTQSFIKHTSWGTVCLLYSSLIPYMCALDIFLRQRKLHEGLRKLPFLPFRFQFVCMQMRTYVSQAPIGFGVLFGDRISRWLAVQQIRYMPVSTTQHWDWDYKSVLCFPLKEIL